MDGFQLSSGYCAVETSEGIKRCTFTWNYKRFKDPADWFAQMTKRGILVSPNIKPGMLLVHPMLEEMKEKGMFLPDSEDNPGQDGLAVGTWWGGPGLFVDYTKESTRQHWKQYIKDALLQYGCRSLWNDDCGLLMPFYLFRMPVLYCHTILLLIYTFCLLLSSILVCAVI